MEQKLNKLLEINSELKEAMEVMIKNEDYRILLYSLSKTASVMQWAKDINGVYTFANDALAKHLFDSERGEDLIGKNDMEIVGAILEKYPNCSLRTESGGYKFRQILTSK